MADPIQNKELGVTPSTPNLEAYPNPGLQAGEPLSGDRRSAIDDWRVAIDERLASLPNVLHQ